MGHSGTKRDKTPCLLWFLGGAAARWGSRLLVGVSPPFGDFRGGFRRVLAPGKSCLRAFEGAFRQIAVDVAVGDDGPSDPLSQRAEVLAQLLSLMDGEVGGLTAALGDTPDELVIGLEEPA